MQKVYKVAIVGGGASGLFCAINLCSGNGALNGEDVVILEKLNRVGKKLIATGNGQGNLTNANIDYSNYYGDKGFIKAFLDSSIEISVEKSLNDLSIFLREEEHGKKYPLSKQASSVLDIFRERLDEKKVNVKTDFEVKAIKKTNGIFMLKSANDSVFAEKVVLACGGKAGAQFGTDGSAYKLALSFGHKLTELSPSIVQLKTEKEKIKGLKGVKEEAKVTLLDGDKPLKSFVGDLLFTDYGVSGNTIFYVSAVFELAKNPMLKIEFLPTLTKSELEEIIKKRLTTTVNLTNENVFTGIINKRIGKIIADSVTRIDEKTLAEALKSFYIKPIGTLSFDSAQVTKGGVDVKDVNPFTCKSKLEKDLYITGEMLSVDGDCGGYNLNFAFLSAIKVANSIKQA